MTRKQLEKGLEKAIQKQSEEIARDGYQYSFHGYAFDAEIESRKEFAIYWRQQVLHLYDKGNVIHRAKKKSYPK